MHHLHANSFAQSYMLGSKEWREAKDRTVNIQGKDHSLQHLILQICKRLIAQSDIEWDSEVPKIKRPGLTTTIFRDVCVSVVSGAEYVMDLRQEFSRVWNVVGAAEKLAKRLIVDGETSFRNIFCRGFSISSGSVKTLDFATSDPGSDFCTLLAS